MRFASAISEAEDGATLVQELVTGVASVPRPDLAVLFYTAPWVEAAVEFATTLRSELQPRVFLGVSAESILGQDREVERSPAASLLVGSLPGVTLQPFHLSTRDWPTLLPDDERLQQRVGTGAAHRGQLLLADPFSTPVDQLLARLDETLHAPTFGGMASAGQRPGSNVLILNEEFHREGAVGVGFGGPLQIDTVVSQGGRPVGQPMVITRVEDGMIVELGRRPALDAAQETLRSLSPEDLEIVQSAGLMAGVVMNEYQETFERGDFLVRGIGVHRETGALLIGDFVRPGQTIQFHVLDANTAHEDLTELLRPHASEAAPAGGLLFSCNGRGTRMFPSPHHDARTTQETLSGLPLAGFFAMGELGPVGGKCYIHGHTASIALFRPAASDGA